MPGGEGGGVGRDDNGREGRRDGAGRAAVEEEEGGVEASDRAVPEADIGSAAVEGGGGGGDGEEDVVERERRRESGKMLAGGDRGVGRGVEVVEIEKERDGE